VSNDRPEKLKAFASAFGITFPLLSDVDLSATKAYGIHNERERLAYPTSLVIDPRGVVRWVREDIDFRVRPATEELLATLRTLQTQK